MGTKSKIKSKSYDVNDCCCSMYIHKRAFCSSLGGNLKSGVAPVWNRRKYIFQSCSIHCSSPIFNLVFFANCLCTVIPISKIPEAILKQLECSKDSKYKTLLVAINRSTRTDTQGDKIKTGITIFLCILHLIFHTVLINLVRLLELPLLVEDTLPYATHNCHFQLTL